MPRRAPLCRWVPYFPRMSASLLLMEANSSRCASVSASFLAGRDSLLETLRPRERPAELLLVECHLGLPLLSWTALSRGRAIARAARVGGKGMRARAGIALARPMKSAPASGVDLGTGVT
jgi:hypothetical protein